MIIGKDKLPNGQHQLGLVQTVFLAIAIAKNSFFEERCEWSLIRNLSEGDALNIKIVQLKKIPECNSADCDMNSCIFLFILLRLKLPFIFLYRLLFTENRKTF